MRHPSAAAGALAERLETQPTPAPFPRPSHGLRAAHCTIPVCAASYHSYACRIMRAAASYHSRACRILACTITAPVPGAIVRLGAIA